MDVYSYISTNTFSDSTVTLYAAKSLIFAGNLTSFPVLQSNWAACQPHVITQPSNFPSDKLEPEWVQESSVAQKLLSIFGRFYKFKKIRRKKNIEELLFYKKD